MNNSNCLFCKIIKKDIPSNIVFEDNKILAFEDINPQAPVHIVVIPKYHIDSVAALKDENIHLVGSLVLAAKEIAKKKGVQESGYRIIFNCNKDAGQAVFHIHLHLLGGRKFAWPPG